MRYTAMFKDDKNEKLGNSTPSYSRLGVSTSTFSQKAFSKRLANFIGKTNDHAIQAANPGGYYTGLWCRDSSYILKDWFLSGRIQEVLDQILVIWSHQLDSGNNNDDRVVFGRGSPEMDFKPTIVNKQIKKRFHGSLPTSIYHEKKICEVFGKDPDIDSTALMISTTSWILSRLFAKNSSAASSTNSSAPDSLNGVQKVLDFTIPRMHKAVEYLTSRDIDHDGLLEQGHNEDWMDSIMRAGKIVYSQACWILALSNFSLLLQLNPKKQENSIEALMKLADTTIKAIEEKLWSEEDGAYIDVQETHHIGGPYRTLTQDISLYGVALSENTSRDSLSSNDYLGKEDLLQPRMIRRLDGKEEEEEEDGHRSSNYDRLVRTLGAIRRRAWKEKWPLVTEVELISTGPWHLKPYQYHNHTFWPGLLVSRCLLEVDLGNLKNAIFCCLLLLQKDILIYIVFTNG
ncbi:MAG: hypothetical protein ACJ70U_09525 [Nitrososphaera sp.]